MPCDSFVRYSQVPCRISVLFSPSLIWRLYTFWSSSFKRLYRYPFLLCSTTSDLIFLTVVQNILWAGQDFTWQSSVQNIANLQPPHFFISVRRKVCLHPLHLPIFAIPFASSFLSCIQLQYDLVSFDKQLITHHYYEWHDDTCHI